MGGRRPGRDHRPHRHEEEPPRRCSSPCLCRQEEQGEARVAVLFAHTTTLGVRERLCARYTLARSQRAVETAHGAR